jgi:hypothetical protein
VEEPDDVSSGTLKTVRRWALVVAATLAFFYAMDHALMSVQGLPLNWNMSPRS